MPSATASPRPLLLPGSSPANGRAAARIRGSRLTLLLAAALLLIAGLLLGTTSAAAHGRSVSYSSWEIDETGATVSLRLKLLELSRLGPQALPPGSLPDAGPAGSPDLPARAFPTELVLLADGRPCSPDSVATRRPDARGWIRYQWRVHCPENPKRLSVHSQILLAVAPSHMHFARARFVGVSDVVREQVLTEAAPEFVLRELGESPSESAIGSRFVDYFRLGVEHILSGWDHLAFVFGLLLLASRLGDVARLVTGFTLAHSLTLALAVLELVEPRAAAVEAVIAFSVGLVAIEKGWLLAGRPKIVPIMVLVGLVALAMLSIAGLATLPLLTIVGLVVFTGCYFALIASSDSEWLRVCLTFAFGLVHGFGFAGILVEMSLPPDRLVPALLGFNLGVEAGQIGVVLLLWPLLLLGQRSVGPRYASLGASVSAAALCGLGLFWLVERAFEL